MLLLGLFFVVVVVVLCLLFFFAAPRLFLTRNMKNNQGGIVQTPGSSRAPVFGEK